MDGTLIDSDAAHFWAFNQMLAPFDVVIDHERFERVVVGGNNETIMRELLPQIDAQRRAQLAQQKEALVLHNLHRIRLVAGAAVLVRSAAAAGRRIAVVTNAPRANAMAVLAHFELAEHVDTVVAAEDVQPPKPAPDPYREALRRCAVSAAEAVAFEDSVNGVTAAARADITVYGVTGSRSGAPLLQAGATACVATLEEVRVDA